MATSAFLFPGQGAQIVGMSVDFAEQCPASRAIFAKAAQALGYDLEKVCREGPQEALNRTDVCQPALLAAALAALEFVRSRRDIGALECSAAAGLSLGEYTALVFADALSLEDGLRLVGNRGRYMQEACEAVESGMSSVLGLDRQRVEEACAKVSGIVGVANLNSPGQVVIAGEKRALAAAEAACKELGARRVIPLQVAGAYHSPLMKPAQEKLQRDLATVAIRPPSVPIASNVGGKYLTDPEEIRHALAVQVVSPVLWEDCMRTMIGGGIANYYEFGPGGVLAGLARKIDSNVAVTTIAKVADMEKFG